MKVRKHRPEALQGGGWNGHAQLGQIALQQGADEVSPPDQAVVVVSRQEGTGKVTSQPEFCGQARSQRRARDRPGVDAYAAGGHRSARECPRLGSFSHPMWGADKKTSRGVTLEGSKHTARENSAVNRRTTRPVQAWMRRRSLRLNLNMTPAPNSGSGPGTGVPPAVNATLFANVALLL